MKRIGRLIFDIIGLALALFALIMGIIAISGHIPSSVKDGWSVNIKDAWESRDVLREAYPTAFWIGVVATAMGAIAAIVAVVSIIMVFRAKSHLKQTIFVWVITWIAAGLAGYVVYQLWNIDPNDLKDAATKIVH